MQAALAAVNAATAKQEMIDALENNANVLGLDVGENSDYAKLVDYPSAENSRHWSVGVDLLSNKPDEGYDLTNLQEYFNAIVATRLATQASMDKVNNAESIEDLEGISWVTDLLAQFEAAAKVYEYHSGIALSEKVNTLKALETRYNALPEANQQAALQAVFNGKPYSRSQATTEWESEHSLSHGAVNIKKG